MSGQGKLDQSLDEIMKDTKPTRAGRGRGPRRVAAVKAAAATAAPAGGVAKKTRAPRGPKAVVAAAVPTTGESKIIVSGLVSCSLLPIYQSTTNKPPA
jgi:THO complex subunit 4